MLIKFVQQTVCDQTTEQKNPVLLKNCFDDYQDKIVSFIPYKRHVVPVAEHHW